MFNFDDLVLEQLTYELRFENGYLYWDNTGNTWKEILDTWPSVKGEIINPQEANLVMPDEDITLRFSPTVFLLGQTYPLNLDSICEFGDSAYDTVMKQLDVMVFTRVGNRFMYSLKLDSSEKAVELMKKTGFFAVPEDKKSKIGDTLKDPGMKFTIVRADEIGYNVNIAYFSRKLDVKLPRPLKYKLDMSQFSESGLLIDIDYHTLKPVERGKIKTSELIRKNKKDIKYIIGNLFL